MAVAMSLLVYLIGNALTGIIGGIIYLIRGARGMIAEKPTNEPASNEQVANE
jgi:hypothetical protein